MFSSLLLSIITWKILDSVFNVLTYWNSESTFAFKDFYFYFYMQPLSNQSTHPSISPSLLRDNVSYPLEVGRVALVNRQADDLGHLIRMIRAGREGSEQIWVNWVHREAHSTYKQQYLKPYSVTGWVLAANRGNNQHSVPVGSSRMLSMSEF